MSMNASVILAGEVSLVMKTWVGFKRFCRFKNEPIKKPYKDECDPNPCLNGSNCTGEFDEITIILSTPKHDPNHVS